MHEVKLNYTVPGGIRGERERIVKMDKDFKKEIKKLPIGSDFRKLMRSVGLVVSHRYQYDDAIKQFGRASVAVCTAIMMLKHKCDFENDCLTWANIVLDVLPDRDLAMRCCSNFLHPAIPVDNSCFLRKVTIQN